MLIKDITNYLSSRDPINVNDDSKASKCPLGWSGQGGEKTTCNTTPTSIKTEFTD